MSKKKIIAIFSLLLVGILTVSAISYSIAGLGNGDEQEIESTDVAKAPSGEYISAIDMIIENSYEAENNTLNIVEVLPMGTSPSALKTYIENGNFKNYVIDANATNGRTMAEDTIRYDYIPVNNATLMTDKVSSNILGGTVEISAVLNSADLIYLTSPAYNSYLPDSSHTTRGMSEAVYDYLHTYASGKNKPLIMDYVKKTDTDSLDGKTYAQLVEEIQLNYIRYKTFPWVDGYTAANFFKNEDPTGQGKSHYISYASANRDYNVLDISVNASGGTIKAALESGYTAMKTRAYYGTETPNDTLDYTVVSPATLTSEMLNTHYDFIVIESDAKSSNITADVYAKLKALSETGRYIFYGTDKVASSSGGGSSFTSTNNYLKLMNLLMTSNGLRRQRNVLPVRPGHFTRVNNEASGEYGRSAANDIAELFNNSDYRGSSNSGESRKFRVLEIEPCYPIDLDVAEANPVTTTKYTQNDTYGALRGGYYTIADQVLTGVSKDEVADQEHGEYYAFQMSKAKISQITGIAYNNIEVEQVSANELASSKEVIAETYDMVYIGGNANAYVQSTHINFGQGTSWTGQYQNDYLARFTNFDMYTHTGYLSAYQIKNGFGSVGSSDDTSVVVSGHDITMNKMNELKDYVDAGLPVIIDKQLSDAYDLASSKERLEQLALHDLDPDCYMYQFLKYTKDKMDASAIANVSWGDLSGNPRATGYNCVKLENPNNQYGETYIQMDSGAPAVTLFDPAAVSNVTRVYNNSKVRPTLTIKEAPSEYDQHDKSTVHSEQTFEVSASAVTGTTAGTYNFYLLVDENGDGVFDFNDGEVDAAGSECKDMATGSSATLSYALDDDFFGLISWKVVAYDATNATLCDAKLGSAFFKIDPEAQKTCRVLQIMPITKGYAFNDGHSLFFCTECEQACGLLDYNISINGHDKHRGTPGLNSNGNGGSNVNGGVVDGMYLGMHEHTFGIVKYDSSIDVDDWEDNYADELTIGPDNTLETGDFTFDLDIVSVDQFDEYCLEASRRSDSEAESNAAMASDLEEDYQEQLESVALTSAESALRAEMFKAAALFSGVSDSYYRSDAIRKGIGTEAEPGLWMIKGQYYRFFEYFNRSSADWGGNYDRINNQLTTLRSLYTTYIKEKDKAIQLKNEYKTYARQAGTANDWISENYDIVVLGFAEKFGGRDVKVESASQLKAYVENGGSILNTHESMTRYNDTSLGSYNLTSALLEAFGMDRFHVTGIDDGSGTTTDPNEASVRITNQTIILDRSRVTQTFTPYKIVIGGTEDWRLGQGISLTSEFSKDCNVTFDSSWGNISQTPSSVTMGREHNGIDFDDVVVNVKINEANDPARVADKVVVLVDNNKKIIASGKTDSEGAVVLKVPQTLSGDGYARSSEVSIGTFAACNITATVSMTSSGIMLDESSVTTQPLDENQENARIQLNVSNYAELPPTASFTLTVGREVRTASLDVNGAMNFEIPISAFSSRGTYQDAINDAASSSSKYIRYICGKDYAFFTERLISGDSVKYNSPIGITDMFVSFDSSSNRTGMYKYVMMSNEAFDGKNLELDGSSYEAKYGTRRASKVNQGGLTTYPFAVADELLIAGTHSQMFTLDLDDTEVNVWYTLGANFVSERPPVDEFWTRYGGGIFAASPHDGLNNYFLYSKGNVFYTGAGHERVVGVLKDNNDERKLFINVIVNSVTKGTKKPKIKLYNVCPTESHAGTNCDDEYVNPNDTNANKLLSKEMNKLYYMPFNDKKMYQYNVEETDEDIYPTFDFKVIAGSADLKEIQVFYDLDYGKGPGMVESNDYQETYDSYTTSGVIDHTQEVNHYMIFQYRGINAKNMDSVRKNLNNSIASLKLQEDFMKNYSHYTYIVIKAKDAKNNVKTARIKINVIPHLFDLTDATIDYPNCGFTTDGTTLDYIDKKKFNL